MTTTFNITPELWQEMRAFSTDSRPRFLYVITHHNLDGSLNMGYSGRKTADTLSQANTYPGSSTDTLFSEERILSHRSEYQFIIVGYCRSTEELGNSEDALNQYMKGFYKKQWANKKVNGKWTTEGLISIIKDGVGKRVRPEELDTYLNDGWAKGSLNNGLIYIIKDGVGKRVNPEELDTYLNDGWAKGSLNKGFIPIRKDGVGKMVNSEELDTYLNDGWVQGSLGKGLIWVNKEGVFKRVTPEELDTYLNDGWVEGNLSQGTISILKDGVGKKVKPEELDTYLNDGWVVGGLNKGTISIIKDEVCIRVNPEELDTYLNDGWVQGNLSQGTISIIKEGVYKRVNPEELDTYLNCGWIKGNKDSYKVLIDKEGNEHRVFKTDVLGKLKEDYRFTSKNIRVCNTEGKLTQISFERAGRGYDREKQHLKLISMLESGLWQIGDKWK